MSLNLPENAQVVIDRSKTDVQRLLPGSNPFLKNSYLCAIITSNANRTFDFYDQLRLFQLLLFPDTATGEFLERWAAIFGVTRLPATQSEGNVIAGGVAGTNIPLGTVYVNTDGQTFTSTSTVSVTAFNTAVSSLTRSGTTATCITVTEHNLSNNISVTISGADQAEYNGVKQITVIDEFTFTYSIDASVLTPATGTIFAIYDAAVVPVLSDNFQDSENDVNVNLITGALLNLQTPIVSIDDTAGVDANGLVGGTDQETDEALRERMLDRIQNPVAHFNVSDIEQQAKQVPGVTRVFVFEITPAVGQVTIYFMRDNDDNPIPDAGEVTTVKDKILEIKPANTADIDVIVEAPTPVITDFTFTALTPNTLSMQSSVTANLQQFFAEKTEVGVDIQEDAYRAAIQNTVDTETGQLLQDFTLSAPSGDITIATGEIGVLGTVTYS